MPMTDEIYGPPHPLDIPEFLRRKPGDTVSSAGGYSASRKSKHQTDLRTRFPLTEADKMAIRELELQEANRRKVASHNSSTASREKKKQEQAIKQQAKQAQRLNFMQTFKWDWEK